MLHLIGDRYGRLLEMDEKTISKKRGDKALLKVRGSKTTFFLALIEFLCWDESPALRVTRWVSLEKLESLVTPPETTEGRTNTMQQAEEDSIMDMIFQAALGGCTSAKKTMRGIVLRRVRLCAPRQFLRAPLLSRHPNNITGHPMTLPNCP
ncbi:hypothetical protein Syun_012831 [Stephania yunnanensis]|uniref:Uncharacterized protein n=1 Tax=Stephania yunnanensis TaxID=152371 RepID=A0AAP0K0A9_9MAGN